jgi:hypothetical protein
MTVYSESNPAYYDLGSSVAKFRRKAELTKDERRAYGEAVERAVLAKQRQALQRELPSHAVSCASGTSHSDGRKISEAVRQQQRASLLSYPAKVRAARPSHEWRKLYDKAMDEKRRAA